MTKAGPHIRRAGPHPEKRPTCGDMPWTNGSTPATRKERRRRSTRWTNGSPPIGAQPRQITPSRTTLDACQRAGCPIEAGAIHAWLCTWSVRSIDGTVIRRDMLLIDVKRENEIWKATSRYRLDGIRTGRQAQAALLLAATGALRPIQERFK